VITVAVHVLVLAVTGHPLAKQILTNQAMWAHRGTPSAHPVLGAARPLPDGDPSLIRLAFIHSLDAINGIIGRLRQARRLYR